MRFSFLILTFLAALNIYPQRNVEKLGRGLVAIRTASDNVFLSWRITADEFKDSATYNVYRGITLIAEDLNVSNFNDNTTSSDIYSIEPVIKGIKMKKSEQVSIQNAIYKTIPLQNSGDCYVHFSWIGDLDGDGEYDYIVDRMPNVENLTPKVEAYKSDGTFLWRMDVGKLGLDLNGIEGGTTAISNGHWDGLTVYDLDSDGKAEVIIKTGNYFVFGDSTELLIGNDLTQYISVVDGMTGKQKARIKLPDDYKIDGPLQCHFGIGYPDGIHPYIIVKSKNRIGSGSFNLVMTAYSYQNNTLEEMWRWKRNGTNAPDFHQIRIFDIDEDGKDEICDGAYVIDDDGSFKYAVPGAIHGDRFHISDIDPDRPGIEGFAIQQDNPSKLAMYMYDAATGEIISSHYGAEVYDVGRGNLADIDPRYRGYEYWSTLGGVYSCKGEKICDPNPWPNFRIWWDGDALSELLDETKIDKWNWSTSNTSRLLTAYNYGASNTWRGAPTFYGDIFGDWREEVIFEKSDHSAILIFTTVDPTNIRMYTLPHNPAYRNALTIKGYYQSHHLDFYFGDSTQIKTPPVKNILQQQLIEKDSYYIINNYSNKLLTLDSTSNFADSVIFQKSPDYSKNQQWTVTYNPDGYYSIISDNSKNCIELNDRPSYLMKLVQQNYYDSIPNQQFNLIANDNGTYNIKSRSTENCVILEKETLTDGYNFKLSSCDNDRLTQQFKFIKVSVFNQVEADYAFNYSVFPNPATNQITIKMGDNNNTQYTVMICDMLGKKVYENLLYDNQSINIDIMKFQSGFYFIKIIAANGKYKIEKILIQK